MKTKTYKTWKFKELSDELKNKVIENYANINTDYEWWETVWDDAENMGLRITDFNIELNTTTGKWVKDACHTANQIIKNFNPKCGTHITAETFLNDSDKIVKSAERDENGVFISEYGLDKQLDEVEAQFLCDVLKDYSVLFREEYEHLTSRKTIIETIEANDYDFTEDGKIDLKGPIS